MAAQGLSVWLLIYTVMVRQAYMIMKVKKENYRSMQDIHRRSYFAVGMRDTFGRQSKFVIRNIAFRGEEAC